VSPSRQIGVGRARALAACAAALTALGLLSPAPDSASAADPSAQAAASAAFTVRGTNGFTIDVGSERGLVTIAASERRPPIATFSPSGRPRPAGDANGASSIYHARGSSSNPGEVDAPLGRLGRISVRFRPSGETHVTVLPSGDCAEPNRIVRRLGTFTGTIEFQGEHGYTSVAAQSARGSVGTPLPSGCATATASRPGGDHAPWPDPATAVLRAANKRVGTSFRATTTDTGVAFLATLDERLGDGLVVTRRAYAGAPPSTFSFDRALSSARVKPPAPFSGVGRFESGGEHRDGSWTGSLRATFPGVSVPMTGAGFKTSLGAGR
jgi:hypothetical protein